MSIKNYKRKLSSNGSLHRLKNAANRRPKSFRFPIHKINLQHFFLANVYHFLRNLDFTGRASRL